MKTNARFIKSVVKTASETDVILPWTRGERRVEFISKRSQAADKHKKTA